MGNASGRKAEQNIKTTTEIVEKVSVLEEPGPPRLPTITCKTSTEITLKWDGGPGDVGEYEIFYIDEETGEKKQAGRVDSDTSEFTISNLKNETRYQIELVSVHRDSKNLKSKPATVQTNTEPATGEASARESSGEQISSIPVDPRSQEYDDKMTRVERMLLEGNRSSSRSSDDLIEELDYFGKVPPPPLPEHNLKQPYMPGPLHIKEVTSTSATFAWSPAVGEFDNYCISYRSPGIKEVEEYYADPGEERYKLKDLTPNTQYTVYVKPVCWDKDVKVKNISAHFVTAYQRESVADERQDTNGPKPHNRSSDGKKDTYIDGGIATENVTDTSLTVTWDAAIGRFDGYRISVRGPNGEDVGIEAVPADITEFHIEDLEPDVRYTVTIKPTRGNKVVGEQVSADIMTDGLYEEKKLLEKHITKTRRSEDFAFKVDIDREEPIFDQCADLYKPEKSEDKDRFRSRPDITFKESPETLNIGGPAREFFTLLVHSVAGGYTADNAHLLFEGQDDHKVPIHDQLALDKELFVICGRMVQHSIIWGGPGLVGLAQPVKDYVRTGDEFVICSIDDIPDTDIREKLQEVRDCQPGDIKNLRTDLTVVEMMGNAGFGNRQLTKDNRDIVVQDILLYYVIRKRQKQLNQFRRGINCLSLIKLLQKHEQITDVIFPKEADSKPKFCLLCPLLKFGYQTTEGKKEAKKYFLKYLRECEERQEQIEEGQNPVTLERVLMFITGCTMLPPKSYGDILVEFLEKGLARSNTCFKEILIPAQHRNYDDFKSAMDESIVQGELGGFSRL
ncbi:uncharacterized protein [Ptychodera flava]|uniref:uncharacterized protein n=1 Tax=Ptychodera flava TaxID=63121 RepID=UPI00396A4A7F